jgi:hypothetical protein
VALLAVSVVMAASQAAVTGGLVVGVDVDAAAGFTVAPVVALAFGLVVAAVATAFDADDTVALLVEPLLGASAVTVTVAV